MRRISYYLGAVLIAGVAIVSFWVYSRYFKSAPQPYLYFKVERGDIQEAIRVRSEVVSQKEFELEFPFSGTIEASYVRDGDMVAAGQRLMKMETKDFEIEANQLQAVVAQRKADLAKLKAGVTSEEINVSESRLASAQVAMSEAQKNLGDRVQDAYIKSDDAVRAKTDQFFDNPRGPNPTLNITADSQIKADLNYRRLTLESMLNNWSSSLAGITASSTFTSFVAIAKQNTASISDFLNVLSPVVNNLAASPSLLQTTIDGYKTSVSAARTNVNAATTNLISAEEKYKLAASNVALAESELALKRASARIEDITIAEARVKESESALAAVNEKISKSTLLAPTGGKISKIHYEIGEIFRPGKSALTMIATAYKLQADVSELDIAKVHTSDTNNVRIALDAFPGKQFEGRVESIDSKEVIKTEDKYYRVNIAFNAADTEVRPGMSADVTILSANKKDVLKVSELSVYADGKDKYVKLLDPSLEKAESEKSLIKTPIVIGITDGEFVEVLQGLKEGQTTVVTPE